MSVAPDPLPAALVGSDPDLAEPARPTALAAVGEDGWAAVRRKRG